MIETIKIETSHVIVGRKFFSFRYKAWRNGKLVLEDTYDSSHSRSPAYMRKELTTGYATDLVLENQIPTIQELQKNRKYQRQLHQLGKSMMKGLGVK